MAQKGKGSLIRVVALLVVLVALGGGLLYMRLAQSNLNTVGRIESYVNGGGLVGKSLDDVKTELGHENPTLKAGEEGVYLFDMTEKDPKLAVVIEVVIRGNKVNANRTYDMQGAQTGAGGGDG
jgi:hypothetical protein